MKAIFILSALLSVFTARSQFFEGIIKYKVELKNPNPAFMSEEEFKKKNPNLKSHIEVFYFKNNTYKLVNGNNIDLLDVAKQRVYSYTIGADTSLWNDATMASEEVLEIKKTNDRDTILGFICESLMIRTKWGKTIYYFNKDQVKADPTLFTYHKYKSFGEYLKESNCLPLKIVYKTGFDCIVYTATNIQSQKIDDKEFAIPSFRYPIKNHHQ